MREPGDRAGRPEGGPGMGRLEGMPAVLRPRRPEDFDVLYAGTPPWETGLLELGELGERFDTVLDSGLFHVLEDSGRPAFVEGLRAVIPPGGRYFCCASATSSRASSGPDGSARTRSGRPSATAGGSTRSSRRWWTTPSSAGPPDAGWRPSPGPERPTAW
jgi:hypothetical protein